MALKRRHFEIVGSPVRDGSSSISFDRVQKIICAECGGEDAVRANSPNSHGGRNSEQLAKLWERKGWQVGTTERHDLCPQCIADRREARKNKEPEPVQKKITTAPTAEVISVEAFSAKAETPLPVRQPTFDEKRLINQKLEEIYLDAETGYSPGWSDRRVAEDLGVPRKWVEIQRDMNFGPVKENTEFTELRRDALALLAKFDGEVATLRDAERRLTQQAAAIRNSADTLEADASAIKKRLSTIEKVFR